MKYKTKKKINDSEFTELFIKMKNGDKEARRLLIECNLGLVGACLKKFENIYDLDDIKQDGTIGLINAVDTYDIESGVKFSTYATTCIRNNIKAGSFTQAKSFKVPQSLYEKYNIYVRVVNKLQQQLLRNPTLDEIYEEMKKAIDKKNESRKVKLKIDIETVKMLPCLFGEAVSFNKKNFNDDGSEYELIDFYPSETFDSADDIVEKNFVSSLIEQADLSDVYKEILKFRYGFYGRIYSLREVAKILNMPFQSVSANEKKALTKIKQKALYREAVRAKK